MPLKIPFFRLGKWKHPLYGDLNITQETFNQMLGNFKSNVLGRPPFIRIGHDKGNSTTFGYAPAEGWVTDLKQEGEILFGEVEPTSKEAEENIRTKRYRFSSAEYNPDGVDRETGKKVGALLSAIALTNEPFLTRLPEATLLADPLDLFYLDCSVLKEEENMPKEETEVKTMLQKLSDSINTFITSFKPVAAPAVTPPADATAQQLAQMQEQIQQFAAIQTQLTESNKQLAAQLGTESKSRVLAEVERQAAELVTLGIFPVMVDQWKALALSEQGQTMIKLADSEGKESEISQAEAMKKMLLAMPPEHRIKFNQQGTQSEGTSQEKIKLSCDEDVKALGGEVTADGKYKI
jgi:hypothetical protein